MQDILRQLAGGDLRSIGISDELVKKILVKPLLFHKVFQGLYAPDPVIRMRAADVLEKASKNNPGLLKPHKTQIIALLQNDKQQEVCWHMVQIVPRLDYTEAEEKKIYSALKDYLSHKSKIVRSMAIEALGLMALKNPLLLNEVKKIIKKQIVSTSPAVKARAGKILIKLDAQ